MSNLFTEVSVEQQAIVAGGLLDDLTIVGPQISTAAAVGLGNNGSVNATALNSNIVRARNVRVRQLRFRAN